MVCHTGEGATDVPNLHKQPRIGQEGMRKRDWASGIGQAGLCKRDCASGIGQAGLCKRDCASGTAQEGMRKRDWASGIGQGAIGLPLFAYVAQAGNTETRQCNARVDAWLRDDHICAGTGPLCGRAWPTSLPGLTA